MIEPCLQKNKTRKVHDDSLKKDIVDFLSEFLDDCATIDLSIKNKTQVLIDITIKRKATNEY